GEGGGEGSDRRAGGGGEEGSAKRGGGRVESVALSRDHTGEEASECARVEEAGGRVFKVEYKEADGKDAEVARTAYNQEVKGQSVVPTRGFGDFYYKQRLDLPPAKQVVTASPEIVVYERGSMEREEILLLACDGVWDLCKKEEGGCFFEKGKGGGGGKRVTGETLASACDDLVLECLKRGSTDNISALAVGLGVAPPPPPSMLGGRVLFGGG
ncbi:unnamed protein product, partial [Choristocarpus tenellus]